MQKYRIGEICDVIKGKTGIQKAEAGEYPMVVTAENRLTSKFFQFDCKAVCCPLVSSTGHGHASLKRLHYQEGKFALGNILCAIIPKDEKIVLAEYLYVYLTTKKDEIIVPLMKGSANVSLTLNSVNSIEVEVPEINQQMQVINKYKNITNFINNYIELIQKKEEKLKLLKESILDYTTRGKSMLDTFVDTEDDGIKIPKDWEMCQIKQIAEVKGGKRLPQGAKLIDGNTGYAYIRVTNMKNGTVDLDSIKFIAKEVNEKIKKYTISSDDLYLTIAGTIGSVGVIPLELNNMNLTENAVKITNIRMDKEYLKLAISSKFVQMQFLDKKTTAVQPKLAIKKILSTFIFVPPLEEQKRIVVTVKKIFNKINSIESKITKCKELCSNLSKVVI